jgi:hypothetical protein
MHKVTGATYSSYVEKTDPSLAGSHLAAGNNDMLRRAPYINGNPCEAVGFTILQLSL